MEKKNADYKHRDDKMSEPKDQVGPQLLVTILKQAGRPMTTRELYDESRKIIPNCASANIIILNYMRLRGQIKGKREDRKWVWWV